MILGQATEQDEGPSAGGVAAGVIESLVGGIATGISRLVGRSEGGDVEAVATDNTPAIPDLPSDVGTDVVGAGKATARKSSATVSPDAGYYAMGESKPVWPWILGIGLLGGGAWWFIKRRKRARKGK